jgi:hypothetical protein
MIVDSTPRLLWVEHAHGMIGVEWLEAAIAPLSIYGRRRRAGEALYRPGDERAARAAIARVAEGARRLDERTLGALRRAVVDAPDPRDVVVRVEAGETLTDVDFFTLTRFLDRVLEVRALAGDTLFGEIGLPPDPEALWRVLAPGHASSQTFYLSDAFDEDLALARADAAWRQIASDAARSRLFDRIARYAGIEQVRAGEFILLRERIRGPLPPELRVLREAPTYLLCDVPLDEEALAALTVLDAVNRSVAALEERVRVRLSTEVRAHVALLHEAVQAFGALDSFIARVRFAQTYETCVPEIVEGATLCFEEARYLPLEGLLAEHERLYMPISLDLHGVSVITGPNMGGKTVTLRTCGFLAACVAFGLPVPARSARVSLFAEIAWVGGGAAVQDVSLLSAFGTEIMEMCAFWERGASRALLLMDEFARTTTPREGRALLVALLERLRGQDVCILAATHLDHIARDVGVPQYLIGELRQDFSRCVGVTDLPSALAAIADAMEYRIMRADEREARIAEAVALARVLGMDRDVLARADALLALPGAPNDFFTL